MNRLFASRRAALAAFALTAFGAAPLTASASEIKDIKPDRPVRVTYRKLYGELHAELLHTIAKR
jgi:hypothetical protein